MIARGPEVPSGKIVATPVSLLDAYPTILEGVGESLTEAERELPGQSLWDTANADDDMERAVLSEYHAVAAASGAFMIRKGRFKYVHYVGFPAQLFDLEADPLERNDLAADSEHAGVVADLSAELRRICDPEEVDKRAKADQAALVERHGGRDAVLAKGSFSGTPAPGEKAVYG
jgi:choline-sulfatase